MIKTKDNRYKCEFFLINPFLFILESLLTLTFVLAKLITLLNGKKRLLYEGYTYYVRYESKHKNETHWACSQYPKCKANLYANIHHVVSKTIGEHCHGKKKMYVSASGLYVVY